MPIFARRTSEFDPAAKPVIPFNRSEECSALLDVSSPGDLLLLVGSTDEQIAHDKRGSLLGLAAFGRNPIPSIDKHTYLGGPIFLHMQKAWSFDAKLKLIDTLTEHLSFRAERCVRLSEQDSRAVLALPRTEIPLLSSVTIDRIQSQLSSATTGPKPADWSGFITREAGRETWTYLLRFGSRDIWKIGQTQDIARRLEEVNQHVPHEETGERWEIVLAMRWSTAYEAYAMEQAVLAALKPFRSIGERVSCSEVEIRRVWMHFDSEM